jgi:23S rRNA pseudouridine1911/1915/1917 synthase
VSIVTGRSRSESAAVIASGGVRVDGRVATSGKARVAAGQELEVDVGFLPDTSHPAPDADVPLAVVHEDAELVVIDKPAGLVVHPGSGNEAGTLVNGLLARYPELAAVGDPQRPGIVHRLDKDTTGLLVVARNTAAYDALVTMLGRRQVERLYLAIVWGQPAAPHGVIDAPLGRSAWRATRMAVSVEGKEARTRYDVRRSFRDPAPCSLVECRLETGRTHQIRVHLAAIGHSVVGDRDYGGARAPLPAPRPMLHAHRLAFAHPATGEPLSFTSPVPDDMATVLAGLS